VRVEAFANSKTGYRIVFVFVSNPYFEDQVLSKEVHFTEMEDHPAVICRVTGCQPTWKDEVGRDCQILAAPLDSRHAGISIWHI
jgi:hypothetical protein